MRRVPLLLSIALLLPTIGLAAPQGPPAPTCRHCSDAGTLVCKKHGAGLEGPPGSAVRCSEAVECKACSGALVIDCGKCRNETVENELAERQRLAREWLAGRRAHVDATTGKQPFLHLETAHFDLTSGLKAATVGKEKLDPHARLHGYGDRLEALRTAFVRTLELTDADLPQRMRVYLFEDAKDHGVVGPRETGMGSANSTGLKLMGPQFVYSMWHDRRSLPDDEAVHRNVVHHTTHLLLSQLQPERWLGNRQHGWIDEGIAHWFEDHLVGKCTNYCYEEVLVVPGTSFKGGKWRPAVRRLVDEGKAEPFAVLASRNTDQLTHEQHALSFALIDWLLAAHGGAKLRDFVRLLKQEQPTREALATVYGLSPLTIDEPFRAWVVATYPRER